MQLELAKDVIDAAADFLAAALPVPRGQISLEQIEERPAYWSVVLSYPESTGQSSLRLTPPRAYKELLVDSDSKEIKAVKFWKPA